MNGRPAHAPAPPLSPPLAPAPAGVVAGALPAPPSAARAAKPALPSPRAPPHTRRADAAGTLSVSIAASATSPRTPLGNGARQSADPPQSAHAAHATPRSARSAQQSARTARARVPVSRGGGDSSSRSSTSSAAAAATPKSAGAPAAHDDGHQENVRVLVRCRPAVENDGLMSSDNVVVDEQTGTVRVLHLGVPQALGGRAAVEHVFEFGAVLGPPASQLRVFCDGDLPQMLSSCLEGYNASVLAYGQTGAGKTHTLEGTNYSARLRASSSEGLSASDWGVVPRAVHTLYDLIAERSADSARRFFVRCTFVQVYNERVIDLFNPAMCTLEALDDASVTLKLRYRAGEGFFIEGAVVYECRNAGEMMEIWHAGLRNRVVGSSHVHELSSRSHAVFTVYIDRVDVGDGAGAASATHPRRPQVGKLTFVDLAGSERLAGDVDLPKWRVRETVLINRGLLALGQIITAMSSPNKRGHAPFRDSNLTKLLQDSLGGRARTLLIACVAPGDKYAEETLRTLKYASRAASIQNTVMTNDSAEAAEIRRLQREVSALRRRLGRSGASGDASALDSGDESGAEAAAGESRLRVRDLYVDPDREDADGDAGGAVPSPRGRAGFALAATNSGLFVSVRGDALSSAGRRARPGADAHRTPTEAAAFSAAGAFADDDPPAARRAATGMLTVAQMRQLLTP